MAHAEMLVLMSPALSLPSSQKQFPINLTLLLSRESSAPLVCSLNDKSRAQSDDSAPQKRRGEKLIVENFFFFLATAFYFASVFTADAQAIWFVVDFKMESNLQ